MAEPTIEDRSVIPSAPLDGRRKHPGIPVFGAGLVSKEEAEAAEQEAKELAAKIAEEAKAAQALTEPAAIVEVEGKTTVDAPAKAKGGAR